ncbi:DNA repair protein XRCC3-like [Periophthalmus magnuspinnatus]|uniref:DNA repair protein XRCC3-like n=1 Tax=Periophthalmus magnuspinnatus TaxID=409849 RepID=UPI00243686B5|nr:DNA repair protein XRCC3-like [Periophthalmus magnuspinnatus]
MSSAGKWSDNPALNPRIQAALRRVTLTQEEILALNPLVVQRATGLSLSDVQSLRQATRSCSAPQTALLLTPAVTLSSGCSSIDRLLRGGLPVGGVTELFGPSAVGKTQLALQFCLSVQYPPEHGGLDSGAVYVCTEDMFPSRRLQQLISEQSVLRSDVPLSLTPKSLSDRVFVEHAADLPSLLSCLTRRVVLLLSRGLVRLVVVDSVAALFRSEFEASDWLQRHQQLLAVSSALRRISRQFNAPVLCINQVVDLMNPEQDQALGPAPSSFGPALGLAWSNQLTVRLMMRREEGLLVRGDQSSTPRSLQVNFASHLPSADQSQGSTASSGQSQGCVIIGVWREGLRGEDQSQQREMDQSGASV